MKFVVNNNSLLSYSEDAEFTKMQIFERKNGKIIECPLVDGELNVLVVEYTSIDFDAFSFCKNVKKIKIPQGVTHIKRGAFSACEELLSIEIPASVNKIGVFDDKYLDACVDNRGDFCAFNRNDEQLTVDCYRGSFAERYCLHWKIKVNYLD